MIVQHNISALNANRQLNIVRKTGSKSVEKLSSGYRINRAADDAAGLSISEKMRRQVRGLTKAGENVEDGISLCQVADGAMAEMHDMTNRMNELCVQAANGTNSTADRSYIQMEIDGIVTEFDRIINTTKFNEIYVFKGDYTPEVIEGPSYTIMSGGGGLGSVYGVKAWTGSKLTDTFDYDPNDWITTKGTYSPPSARQRECAWVDFTNFTANSKNELIAKLNGEGFDNSCCFCSDSYGIKFVSGETYTDTVSGINYNYNKSNSGVRSENLKISLDDIWNEYKKPGNKKSLGEVICSTIVTVIEDAGGKYPGSELSNHYTSYAYKEGTGKLYIFNNQASVSSGGQSTFNITARDDNGLLETPQPAKPITINTTTTKDINVMPKTQLAIQAGTDTDLTNKVIMRLPSMSKESLRLNKVSVLTEDFATDSIDVLSETLRLISEDRSRIGAYQNRLEHTALNLDNIVENTTNSESKIRDTDMADEMVRYSNNNILAQAGQSMLSQANSSTQGILSLLSA